MSTAPHLEQLRADVRYLRERRDLYRARVYGPRPARVSRLEELERQYELAESRLQRAERETASRSRSSPRHCPQASRATLAARANPSHATFLSRYSGVSLRCCSATASHSSAAAWSPPFASKSAIASAASETSPGSGLAVPSVSRVVICHLLRRRRHVPRSPCCADYCVDQPSQRFPRPW